MKLLIVARHGQYNSDDGHLNKDGCAQISALAEKLKPLINGVSVLILSSSADRAYESAKILSVAFGVKIEKHSVLTFVGSPPERFDGVLDLVRSRKDKADVLILVTHNEHIEFFSKYLTNEELGIVLDPKYIGPGEALVNDCLRSTLTHSSNL